MAHLAIANIGVHFGIVKEQLDHDGLHLGLFKIRLFRKCPCHVLRKDERGEGWKGCNESEKEKTEKGRGGATSQKKRDSETVRHGEIVERVGDT